MTNGFARHDHAACIDGALAAVEAACAARKLRLTPVRRRVLEMLLQEHRAMGAYDVLDRLRAEGFGAQPPVAYRALDFLTSNGFAHRVEHLNAFIACARPGEPHAPAFLICRRCEGVAETDADADAAAARATGFRVERAVVELGGVCPDCQTEGA